MHWDTFKQDNYSTVGEDGGCRVGKVQAGTTSPMPDHMVTFQKFSTFKSSDMWMITLLTWGLKCRVKCLYVVLAKKLISASLYVCVLCDKVDTKRREYAWNAR